MYLRSYRSKATVKYNTFTPGQQQSSKIHYYIGQGFKKTIVQTKNTKKQINKIKSTKRMYILDITKLS